METVFLLFVTQDTIGMSAEEQIQAYEQKRWKNVSEPNLPTWGKVIYEGIDKPTLDFGIARI